MTPVEIIISFVGGFSAGVLNTFAGFGSVITLAIYMDMMNLPGHIANATNRVNILASTTIGTITFYKNGKLDVSKSGWIILTVLVGAIAGVILATRLDNEGFKTVFNYALIPILIILIMNPKKIIQARQEDLPSSKWITIPILFLLGVYAGFIQVGFGVLFIIVLVILAKQDLIKSNALKVAIVATYTIVAVLIFHFQGMIDWKAGISLTAGQALGGFFAAHYASKMKSANKWAYRILVAIILGVIIKNFHLWTYFV